MNRTKIKQKKIPELRFPGFEGEWEEKKLGEVGKTINGLTGKSKDDFGEGKPFITYKQIFDKSEIDTEKFAFVKIEDKEKQNRMQFGDIFFTTSSETPLEVGFSSVLLDKKVEPYLNSFSFALRPKSLEQLYPHFSRFFFRSPYFRKKVVRLAQGSTRFNLSKVSFKKFDVLLPSSEEQQKIAEFLGSVDEWVENLKKQKKNLQAYKKGLMHKIFSQAIRFKDDNGKDFPDWDGQGFLDIFKSISIKKYQIKNSDILESGSVEVVDQGAGLIAGYSNNKSKTFSDIPVVVFGDHTTIVKYVDFDFIIGADGTKVLKNKRKSDNLKFLSYLLKFDSIDPEGYKRHYKILKDKTFSVPTSEEQQKIAEFLTSVDELIEFKEKQVSAVKEWKKGLMQRMFV